ncbi:hypothetical protein BC831DRAFT_474336 [Entophlyctis helioformis]|nr:hypothetical protein BC831DRAFT_474336 [Entophlyctis helioformis]
MDQRQGGLSLHSTEAATEHSALNSQHQQENGNAASRLTMEQRLAQFKASKQHQPPSQQPQRRALGLSDANAQQHQRAGPGKSASTRQSMAGKSVAAKSSSEAVAAIPSAGASHSLVAGVAGRAASGAAAQSSNPNRVTKPRPRTPALGRPQIGTRSATKPKAASTATTAVRATRKSVSSHPASDHLDLYYSDHIYARDSSDNETGAADTRLMEYDLPNVDDADIETLQSRLSDEAQKAIQLQIELDARSAEVAHLKSLNDQLNTTLQATNQEQSLQLDIEELLRSTVMEREGQIRQIQTDWAAETDTLKSQLIDKQSVVDSLGRLIAELREEIESLKRQPSAYADALIHLVRIEELEALVKTKDARIRECETEISDCYQAIDALEKQERKQDETETELHTRIEHLNATLITREMTIYVQEKELSEQAARIETLEDALKESSLEAEALSKELAEKTRELKDAYEVIDIQQAQIKDFEEEVKAWRAEIIAEGDAQSQLIDQGLELKSAYEAIDLLQAENADLEKDVALWRKEVVSEGALQTQVIEQGIELEQLRKAVEEHAQIRKDLASQLKEQSRLVEQMADRQSDTVAIATAAGSDTAVSAAGQSTVECQTELDIVEDLQVAERQIVVLKFAHHVATLKLKEADTKYTVMIREMNAKNEAELKKWSETADEHKALVDRLFAGVTRSAQRVKELEAELQTTKAEYQKMQAAAQSTKAANSASRGRGMQLEDDNTESSDADSPDDDSDEEGEEEEEDERDTGEEDENIDEEESYEESPSLEE